MKKILIILLCLMALEARAGTPPSPYSLSAAVIQGQFEFTKTNVKRAAIITKNNGTYAGLQIEIKPEYADAFVQLSKDNVGKAIAIICNQRVVYTAVIQSPLSNDILLTGIPRDEALLFIDHLMRTR